MYTKAWFSLIIFKNVKNGLFSFISAFAVQVYITHRTVWPSAAFQKKKKKSLSYLLFLYLRGGSVSEFRRCASFNCHG
jgi:hypothetical protein